MSGTVQQGKLDLADVTMLFNRDTAVLELDHFYGLIKFDESQYLDVLGLLKGRFCSFSRKLFQLLCRTPVDTNLLQKFGLPRLVGSLAMGIGAREA